MKNEQERVLDDYELYYEELEPNWLRSKNFKNVLVRRFPVRRKHFSKPSLDRLKRPNTGRLTSWLRSLIDYEP